MSCTEIVRVVNSEDSNMNGVNVVKGGFGALSINISANHAIVSDIHIYVCVEHCMKGTPLLLLNK